MFELQQKILNDAETNRNFSNEFLDVVVIPICKGSHPFHKECLLNHFKSMKNDDKQVNYYKCILCQATCGNRTGNMPPGTMKWGRDKYNLLKETL